MATETIRDKLIKAGVKNLREFGYAKCSADNILTDYVYRAFFRKMVEETLDEHGQRPSIGKACRELLAEIDKATTP